MRESYAKTALWKRICGSAGEKAGEAVFSGRRDMRRVTILRTADVLFFSFSTVKYGIPLDQAQSARLVQGLL